MYVLEPKNFSSGSEENHKNLILYSVLILQHIWWAIKEMLFKDILISLEASINSVRQNFMEFKHALDVDSQNERLNPNEMTMSR